MKLTLGRAGLALVLFLSPRPTCAEYQVRTIEELRLRTLGELATLAAANCMLYQISKEVESGSKQMEDATDNHHRELERVTLVAREKSNGNPPSWITEFPHAESLCDCVEIATRHDIRGPDGKSYDQVCPGAAKRKKK